MNKVNKKEIKVLFVIIVFTLSMITVSATSRHMAWNRSGIIDKANRQSFDRQGQPVTI